MGDCLGLILFLVIAGVIGWVADLIIPGKMPFGWIGGIVAALIGGVIGGFLFSGLGGPWVSLPGGYAYYIIPGVIGTIIFAFIVRLVLGMTARRSSV